MVNVLERTSFREDENLDGAYVRYLARLAIWDIPGLEHRNAFIEKFPAWRPHWKAEATTALVGLDKKLGKAYQSGGLKAAYYTWDNAKKYHGESLTSLQVLQRVRNVEQDTDPEAASIRDDDEIRGGMAEYLFVTEELDRYKWQPHNVKGQPNPRRVAKIKTTSEEIKKFNDVEIVSLWRLATGSEKTRLNFWSRQLQDANHTPIVQGIKDAITETDVVTEEDLKDYREYLETSTDEA